jgi:hypothetical protein
LRSACITERPRCIVACLPVAMAGGPIFSPRCSISRRSASGTTLHSARNAGSCGNARRGLRQSPRPCAYVTAQSRLAERGRNPVRSAARGCVCAPCDYH